MFVIYDLLILVLFFALFILFYFMFGKLREVSFVGKILTQKMFGEIIEGAIYGGVALLLDFLMHQIYNEVGIAFYYVQFIVLLTITKTKIAAISLMPALLFRLLVSNIDKNTYLVMGVMALFAFSILIAERFVKKIDYRIVIFPLFVLIGIFLVLISVFSFGLSSPETMGFVLYSFVGAVLVQVLVSYSIKTSISANLLYSSINFNFSSFYRASFMTSIIGDMIKMKKIDKAVYGVFKFEWETGLEKSTDREIIETTLTNIEKKFPQETVLFHIEKNKYGFFLAHPGEIDIQKEMNGNRLQKREISSLAYITQLLNDVSTRLTTSKNETANVSVKAGLSIYGIQTDSLFELYKNASFAAEYLVSGSRNKFNMFNPNLVMKRLEDVKSVKELDDVFNLSTIDFVETTIFDLSQKKVFSIYDAKSHNENDGYVSDFRRYVKDKGYIDSMDRYASIETIKLHKRSKTKIGVYYPIRNLSGSNVVENLINKLKIAEVNLKNIVLIFDLDNKTVSKDRIVALQGLKDKEIKIAITDPSDKDLVKLSELRLDYLLVKHSKTKNKFICENAVYFNLKDEAELIEAHKNGAQMYGGKIFKNDIYEKEGNINIIDVLNLKKGVQND